MKDLSSATVTRVLKEEKISLSGSGVTCSSTLKNDIRTLMVMRIADMKKTISVWCSDDQQLALDIVKSGGQIEEKTCDNPIKEHLAMARELGVRGTPAIILEDGQLLPGYVPVDKLVAEIRK